MYDEFNIGTDDEKAKAALCREIAGCVGSLFFPCDGCEEYKNLQLSKDEYKISIADVVYIKHEAIERETAAVTVTVDKWRERTVTRNKEKSSEKT